MQNPYPCSYTESEVRLFSTCKTKVKSAPVQLILEVNFAPSDVKFALGVKLKRFD